MLEGAPTGAGEAEAEVVDWWAVSGGDDVAEGFGVASDEAAARLEGDSIFMGMGGRPRGTDVAVVFSSQPK